MKSAIVVLTLLLVGCSTTVPVKVPFPEVPPQLLEPAGKLKPLTAGKETQLSDIIENTNTNAGLYYELKEKLTAWQIWYAEQKKIFDELNKK
jgi:hypothetical protein